MIRIVSLRKAALAGAAGALAWEAVLRTLILAGLPLSDMVRELGRLAFPDAGPLVWWPLGTAMHVAVGVLWAIFYAYFFWSLLVWRPMLQGLTFAVLPAALAELIIYPQFKLMHAHALAVHEDVWSLLHQVTWGERAGLVIGHAVFGLVMGALYTRPVGYRAGNTPKPLGRATWKGAAVPTTPRPNPAAFIFATGIECSYPTIENGRWRRDQMASAGHYRNWRRDLELAAEIGVSHLRYGPPLHLTYPARGRFDWGWADGPMEAMEHVGLVPIVDLVHFGLPDWLENFQNPEIPEALAAYATAFAKRYPQVRFFTPVNEMYVCARLSALDGIWNEQRRDERAFVTAARNLARASVLMMRAIQAERADAIFITSESGEFYQAASPDPKIVQMADFENERRFLPLDLAFARGVGEPMREHLFANGMPPDEYDWFLKQALPKRTILGVDYYDWNEKLIDTEGRAQSLGELFGWYVIASQYYDRYRLPMMHTETNHMDAREAPAWVWRQWHNVQLIRKAGVPVVGFTWYSLTDQVDWDLALAEALGNVDPVGLFDLNRDPRPVGQAYRYLIREHKDAPGLAECPALKAMMS
jgi:beta-glucosidase/6-phospho-beta-glucosidase/beta-galactosidase